MLTKHEFGIRASKVPLKRNILRQFLQMTISALTTVQL